MSHDASPAGALRDGDNVLFIDRKGRSYLRTLRTGARIALRGGSVAADALIGGPEGTDVTLPLGERFLVVRPTYAQLIPHLPRQAQPIYPKDVGPMLLWGDIGPGMHVVEIGVGAGALTLALLRAVGSTGRVTTYEIREDFADAARTNVERFHGPAPTWTVRVGDAHEGISERDVDRMIIDLAEPWHLVAAAADALRPGGILIGFLPTVLQVKQLVDALVASPAFGAVETLETFLRDWHVEGRSVRPEHRMVAHTGFLVFARRIVAGALAPAAGHAPLDD